MYLEGHGGKCCGIKHIHGMGPGDTVDNILGLVRDGQLVEVTMTEDQCKAYPKRLKELADLGFVLDASWINGNTTRRLFRFSRCDKRRNLTNLSFAWTGMTISSTMAGNLPAVPKYVNKEKVGVFGYGDPVVSVFGDFFMATCVAEGTSGTVALRSNGATSPHYPRNDYARYTPGETPLKCNHRHEVL